MLHRSPSTRIESWDVLGFAEIANYRVNTPQQIMNTKIEDEQRSVTGSLVMARLRAKLADQGQGKGL